MDYIDRNATSLEWLLVRGTIFSGWWIVIFYPAHVRFCCGLSLMSKSCWIEIGTVPGVVFVVYGNFETNSPCNLPSSMFNLPMSVTKYNFHTNKASSHQEWYNVMSSHCWSRSAKWNYWRWGVRLWRCLSRRLWRGFSRRLSRTLPIPQNPKPP